MFLLFELERPDVWPVDDLGVRHGWQLIHDDADLLKPKALQAEGERFRPYRSVVALFCWHAVHVERGQVAPAGEASVARRLQPPTRSSRNASIDAKVVVAYCA